MKSLLMQFKEDVCNKANEIDADELDWFALSIGYFMAKGCSFERAHHWAMEARYKHHYWMP